MGSTFFHSYGKLAFGILIITIFIHGITSKAETAFQGAEAETAFQNSKAETELSYRCEVIIAAEGIGAKEGVFEFSAPITSGTHGGDPKTYQAGRHQVSVVADATWLGLRWFVDGKKIAEGLFVLGPMDRTMSRVGILYDPADSGDQVSIGCSEALFGSRLLKIVSK